MTAQHKPAAHTEPALTAAKALVKARHHVHYVAEGQSRCLSGHCTRQARI